MNYYEHHIGDYAEATAHLSFVEDAAYGRLIRKVYSTERPLPKDFGSIQRLIGARTEEEKAAVVAVLKEFFQLRKDGWHNSRCDEELARFHEKSEKAKRSADARWAPMRQHSERNAKAMRSHSERNANGMRDTQSSHNGRNALQTPDSSLQSPVTRVGVGEGAHAPTTTGQPGHSKERKTATRIPEDFSLTDERMAIAVMEGLDPGRTFDKFRDYWRAASGAHARKLDWDATWRNWCRNDADRGVRPGTKVRAKSLAELEDEAIARLIGEGKSNVDIACEVGVTAARVEAARGGARAVG